MCKTLIYNTQTNQVASLYVDAPLVVVKSRQHDTSLYASLTTNTNPSRPPFRRRLKIAGEMNRDTKRHTAFLKNIYNEAVKNPDRLKHLMPYEEIDASVEYLENFEEMLRKCLKTFVPLLNSAGPETDNRKVDALSTLIESVKAMIGMCQDLRWQAMIHEAQNEPASEKVCESPEEFFKKLWE